MLTTEPVVITAVEVLLLLLYNKLDNAITFFTQVEKPIIKVTEGYAQQH